MKLENPLLTGKIEDEQAIYPEIRNKLLVMAKEDQEVRNTIKIDVEIDKRNTENLKEIISQIGWPTKSKVGKWGMKAAWLIAQHADFDLPFQKEALHLIKSVPLEEIDIRDIAYLEDRISAKETKTQMYGTQFYIDENKIFGPYKIINPEKLNDCRKEFGLKPWEEYRDHMMSLNNELKK